MSLQRRRTGDNVYSEETTTYNKYYQGCRQGCRTGTTRATHVWCVVNSPHYHTCGDFEFFFNFFFPSLFLPFVVTFPSLPEVNSFFSFSKKSKGKTNEFVGDEDINTVFTIFLGEREGERRWWVEPPRWRPYPRTTTDQFQN